MRSRLPRPVALVLLVVAAALVLAVVGSWAALRPAASERDPLPEPIRITTVPTPGPPPTAGPAPPTAVGPEEDPRPPAPATGPDTAAPADPAPVDRVPADVVPPPPLPDDDADDEDGDDDGDGDDDDGAADDGDD